MNNVMQRQHLPDAPLLRVWAIMHRGLVMLCCSLHSSGICKVLSDQALQGRELF